MGDCRRIGERLTPYVDEALPPDERSEVERHLNDCPPCQQSAAHERGGRALMRERAGALRQASLPPGLRSRCEALAHDHARVGTVASWRGRLVPAALAAALTIVAGLALLSVATRRSDGLLAAQLAADHVKCFAVFDPGGEAEAGLVEQTLHSEYGWDMDVPPSSPEHELRLVNGRRCLYADGTVPHVMYRFAGSVPVSLFRLDGVTRGEADVTAMGHRCRIWSRDGHTYVLVAPVSASGRDEGLVQYVRQEAR